MAAVDHDAGDAAFVVVVLLAEEALVLVEDVGGEGCDFGVVEVGGVVGLLEEVGGGVLQFLHLNFELFTYIIKLCYIYMGEC